MHIHLTNAVRYLTIRKKISKPLYKIQITSYTVIEKEIVVVTVKGKTSEFGGKNYVVHIIRSK